MLQFTYWGAQPPGCSHAIISLSLFLGNVGSLLLESYLYHGQCTMPASARSVVVNIIVESLIELCMSDNVVN